MEKHQTNQSLPKEEPHYNGTLLLCSIIVWFVSLAMVGFYHGNTAYFGIGILLLSPIAWIALPAGLAVYANTAYWTAIILIKAKKKPDSCLIIMLILSFLTLGLSETSIRLAPYLAPFGLDNDKLSGSTLGYGALVWWFSFSLLIGAVWDKRKNISKFKILLPYFGAFLAVICASLFYKNYQWEHANTNERARYLPKFSAFALGFKPSGIEYRLPPTHLPNNHLPVEINPDRDVELNMLNSEFKIEKYFYLPESFIYQGYKISRPYQNSDTYIIEKSPIQAVYRYDVVKTKDNQARQSIFDIQQNKEIWYGDVNLNKSEIYPNFNFRIEKLFSQPLPKEQDIRVTLPTTGKWTPSCSIQPIPDEAMFLLYSFTKNRYDEYDETKIRENFIYLDNKIVNFFQPENSHLYCNAHFILELQIDISHATIRVYQSDSFIKIANLQFNLPDNTSNLEFKNLYKKYKKKSAENIQSIELTEQGWLLKHEFGETLLLNQKK